MAKQLRVTLVRSGINRPEKHKLTIRRLGLTKTGGSVVIPDNVSVRGMIREVSHLVRVESADT
jgi:large subunit ribosomal protein L30